MVPPALFAARLIAMLDEVVLKCELDRWRIDRISLLVEAELVPFVKSCSWPSWDWLLRMAASSHVRFGCQYCLQW